jgi:hypothetical protein
LASSGESGQDNPGAQVATYQSPHALVVDPAGQLHRVTTVGFDAVAGLFGNEGG